MNNSLFTRKSLIVVAGVVCVLGVGGFWVQSTMNHETALPKRVCKGYFKGSRVGHLLPDGSGKLRESSPGFPKSKEVFSQESCELYRAHDELSVRAEFPGVLPSADDFKRNPKVVLGKAQGYLEKEGGTITLSVACPSPGHPKDHLRVVSGSSRANSYGVSGKKLKKGIADLSRFSAYATKVLAEKAFKCKGADQLPNGPVKFVN